MHINNNIIYVLITSFIFLYYYIVYYEKNTYTEKYICLSSLLNDVNNEITYSYYRIKDFRCGYNSTINNINYIKIILEKELKNKNKYKYVHEIEKSKMFYTNKI